MTVARRKTAREIESLEQRRAAIFEALQNVYNSLKGLLERKPDRSDVEDFLALETRERPKSGLMKSGWQHPGRNPMNIRPSAARYALPQYPEAIRDLVAAFKPKAAPRKPRLAQVLERRWPGLQSPCQ
jgi:hypothetical protein